MKKVLKSALLLMMGLVMFAACSDDRDDNPTITTPTEFILNTPAIAGNNIDLAHSSTLQLTCSQPNYGFPAATKYNVQISLKEDMSDCATIDQNFYSAKADVDASLLAATLTNLELNAGKTEADFPMDIPVYVRMRAVMTTETGDEIEGTDILSNVVTLSNVHLLYALAPVTVPAHLYVVGNFCGWDWGNSFEFIPVYDHPEMYWRMVWIDESGVKINTDKAWDGNEKGYADITVDGDLKDKISSNEGNISSTTPGWYLMIVTATVEGRDIKYNVQFNEPNVWLMGPSISDSLYGELNEAGKFEVPTTQNGDFVSPAFTGASPGGDDGGLRVYVKIPNNDWWHSEFTLAGDQISYRGTGGDQKPYLACAVGQKLYLNFSTGKGSLK